VPPHNQITMTTTSDNWQILIKEKQYNDLIMEWNKKINLVSRKKTDILDLIEDSHLFLDYVTFKPGTKILDLGTGGGLPGIVLAIHHPEAQFVLIDSITKKVKVTGDIITKMNLTNARAICTRAEELITDNSADTHHMRIDPNPNIISARSFDFVVARSVAVLQDLAVWSKELIKPGGKLVSVKGGDLSGEVHAARKLRFVKKVEQLDRGARKVIIVSF
jgi:16S rRNA (guanine527-N7)-methyltransferase